MTSLRSMTAALAVLGVSACSSGKPPPLDASAPTCDVNTFGAKGDRLTLNTTAIQAAVDACSASGGTVLLHDGTFLSGMITLRSNITLQIAPSATLLGSQNTADYPDINPPIQNSQLSNCNKALVYAGAADRVTIQGGGTINGNAGGVPDWNGDTIPENMRPMAIFTTSSTNVTIQDITVMDAATWAVVNMEVDQLTLSGLTINTDLGPTHDGIDVVDGHHVLIENCNVISGDDSICLKSGSQTGTADVVVQSCHTQQSGVANGVKIGTATVGPISDITVQDVVIENAQSAALAVESVDGSNIANVSFNGITTSNVGTPFFVLLGSRNKDAAQVGSIDGLTFDTITGSNMRYAWGALVTGSVIGDQTFSLSNVSFNHIDLTFLGTGVPPNPTPFTADNFPEYQGPVPGQPGTYYDQYPDAKFITGTGGNENTAYYAPGWAFFVRHASGVRFADCITTVSGADPRPWLSTKDATVTGTCGPGKMN